MKTGTVRFGTRLSRKQKDLFEHAANPGVIGNVDQPTETTIKQLSK